MPDVQEVFRMATQKVRPEPGFVDRQFDHQRRRARNRRNGALALVAALGLVAAVVVIRAAGGGGEGIPAVRPSPTPQAVPAVDYTLDLATGAMTPLPTSIVGEADEAEWYALSPDGSMLSYVGPGDDGDPQIFVANLDGTGIRQVTNDPQGVAPISWSAWSPGGTMLAYEGYGDGSVQNLFVVDVATGASTQVTFSTLSTVFGTQFSPDGSALLYAGGDKGSGVRLAPIGGGKHTLLVGGGGERGDAGNGVFSPDGSMLSYAFSETVGALPAGVWIANADGTDPRQLIDFFLECRPGSWSPDATRLACWELNGSEVSMIDVETGAVTMVAKGSSAIWLDDHTLLIDL